MIDGFPQTTHHQFHLSTNVSNKT